MPASSPQYAKVYHINAANVTATSTFVDNFYCACGSSFDQAANNATASLRTLLIVDEVHTLYKPAEVMACSRFVAANQFLYWLTLCSMTFRDTNIVSSWESATIQYGTHPRLL